ncbi:Ctr copper transporter family-domain-containing protein [Bipolaris maydis]|uniref:Ctr copper transporter family-domain-containing protein n=1 Tax=Cochliobolus heterostrophus TaxID=5016 RepID=UPI0024D4C771|nr:Ctr copper transporter family-domain-containing protein [Bipolaris maydis]KAJ6197149.1 Ctr copper transporter family-domain-containing protein [Bipolaris maydis]KAJ6271152.1 Ctr copper transporter family-domain-containing protein [Bipolaris maydis]KAJ6282802.1 Ctr copper transporter family-domain-containing protein [Bipolaris maydis]
MDHSHMDHGHMDHGHMDHGMPGMGGDGPKCNMNMLFTWDTTDLCIVFPSWHISGTGSLIFSLLAVVLLTAGYEAIREMSRRYESYAKGLLEGPRGRNGNAGRGSGQQVKMIKAALYAVQVFYSFFIMLLFMTYNGWIMLAVAVGAFVGYIMFSESSSTKSVACH